MRRTIQRKVTLRNLKPVGHWPSGNVRYYVRVKGHKNRPMPDAPPESPAFLKAYADAIEAMKGQKSAGPKHGAGTIGFGCRSYLASQEFLNLAESTRAARRRFTEQIEKDYSTGLMEDLRARHIRQDLAQLDPHPANNKLRAWRALTKFWMEIGLTEIDAARDVRKRATPTTDGHTPWTSDDIDAFRQHWPHDSLQRMAFEVMFRTCAAIGDACKLSRSMVKDGWLEYTRTKSKSMSVVPMTRANAPEWFGFDDHLEQCIAAHSTELIYIITAHGKPKSPKAAAQWFSRAAQDAGLKGKTAHGIRKYRAAYFLENGASEEQRMGILGHETATEARRYSKSADLRKIISGTKVDNSADQVVNFAKKSK